MTTVPYLSKVQLNPLRRGAQQLMSSPQRIHAAVLGSMPPEVDGRVLWRDDIRRPPTGPPRYELLVLTPNEPDWTHVQEQAGWMTDDGRPLVRSLQPLLDMVAVGRQFGFKVRANPTESITKPEHATVGQRRKLDDPKRSRGIRVGHRTAEHQVDWFSRRTQPGADHWGFVVEAHDGHPEFSLTQREHLSFFKGNADGRHRVTLNRATFEGRLTVTDADGFRSTLLGGLGGGKAYGCGLLTLAPVNGHVVAG